MSMLNPTLPGAMIERERKCDVCSCYTTEWREVETTKSGVTRILCPDCYIDYYEVIEDARAFRSAGQQAEDESQEGF